MTSPNVHKIELRSGGIKLVYLTNPCGEIDRAVRTGFKIRGTLVITDPSKIPNDGAFVLDGEKARVYFTPMTRLKDTYYEAIVGKSEQGLVLPVYVGIGSKQQALGIEEIINLMVIECDFFQAGLIPEASQREKLPKYFFKDAI